MTHDTWGGDFGVGDREAIVLSSKKGKAVYLVLLTRGGVIFLLILGKLMVLIPNR